MSMIKTILFILIVLSCNSINFSVSTRSPYFLYAQECFKGGVYEVNIQYKYPKGKETYNRDYKKTFYIHEEKSNPESITLFELVPVPINTPMYNKGGLANNENTHYFIRNYCNHKWDGQHIYLPQSKHVNQESTNISDLNQTDIILGGEFSLNACPVSLYFYGYYHSHSSPSPAIQDTTIGLMKLEEYKETKLSTVTIISKTRKLEWSDNFVNRFRYFSKLLMNRYNNIILQRGLIYQIGGDQLKKWEALDRKYTYDNRTTHYNYYNFPKPEWPKDYPIVTDTCIGFKELLFNINCGLDSRDFIWDMFNEGLEVNKNIFKDEIVKRKEESHRINNELKEITEKNNSLNNLLNNVQDVKAEVQKLNVLLSDGKRSRLFESKEIKSNASVLYEDILYDYKHIHDLNSTKSELKLNVTKPLDNKEARFPKESSYNIAYLNSKEFRVYDDIISIIQTINNKIAKFANTIQQSKVKYDGIFNNYEIISLTEKLMSLTRDTLSTPHYLVKDEFILYRIDTMFANKSMFKLILDDLGRIIDFIKESHKSKDFDLDNSDMFIKKQQPTSSEIVSYLQSDPKKGAKIIAHLFALQSYSVEPSAKKLADYIDDGDIAELLSKLYKIDEDDIDDELEKIIDSKLLSEIRLNNNTFFSFRFLSNENSEKNDVINYLDLLESNLSNIINEITPIIDNKTKFYNEVNLLAQNIESYHNNRVKYTSSVNVKNSNIPDVNSPNLCDFLSNYNLSRGLQEDLFKSGQLKERYIKNLIDNHGKSLITGQNRFKNLITFEPFSSTWNIVSYTSEYFNDDTCKGYGHLHISGFLFDVNSVILNTVSIGNIVKK